MSSSDDTVVYVKESQETMQVLVDSWIKDLKYGIMSLKNITNAYEGKNLSDEHREMIKEVALLLKNKTEEVLALIE